MVYVVGIVGFIGGFILGQMVLHFLLRHKSTEELLNDKSLKYTYGLLGWVLAGVGAYSFVSMYNLYFPT